MSAVVGVVFMCEGVAVIGVRSTHSCGTACPICESYKNFFFQAEDGIRDLVRSRGLGDVYKRQIPIFKIDIFFIFSIEKVFIEIKSNRFIVFASNYLSLIHI